MVGTMPKCPPMGGVRLQEVSVCGGLTVMPMNVNAAHIYKYQGQI